MKDVLKDVIITDNGLNNVFRWQVEESVCVLLLEKQTLYRVENGSSFSRLPVSTKESFIMWL